MISVNEQKCLHMVISFQPRNCCVCGGKNVQEVDLDLLLSNKQSAVKKFTSPRITGIWCVNNAICKFEIEPLRCYQVILYRF